jgi:hypothetical protein
MASLQWSAAVLMCMTEVNLARPHWVAEATMTCTARYRQVIFRVGQTAGMGRSAEPLHVFQHLTLSLYFSRSVVHCRIVSWVTSPICSA